MKEQGPLWVVEHCLCCRDAAVFSVGYNRVEVEMKLDHLLEYWLGKREPTLNPSPAKCAKCRVSAVCRAVG
jgi:CRISPR/Cas system-associated exonuclease Cas4 (RecB family)